MIEALVICVVLLIGVRWRLFIVRKKWLQLCEFCDRQDADIKRLRDIITRADAWPKETK